MRGALLLPRARRSWLCDLPCTGSEASAQEQETFPPEAFFVLVPASLSGPLSVRVANKINGSGRSFTFMDAITPIT
jgi:hypothetical protein